jgi:diguanylate cyclase (GGDEF)-like protein
MGLLYFEPNPALGQADVVPDVYLRMLAENIGLALANLKLRDALHEMAMADPLTGLANRRSLETVLEARLADAVRTGQPLSCLMVDVDHFKRFNDAFGHDAGDAVLREVGSVLKAETRDDGLAFRFGGEEFMVLLPGLETEGASARAEQIRTAIQALRVTHNGRELGAISASIGLASTPAHGSGARLTGAADEALLSAKACGRNRVEVARTEPDRRIA